MTRTIRKAISVICALAILLSLCAVSLTGVNSAFTVGDTPAGSAVKLTFDNDKGVTDTNANGTSLKLEYTNDPWDATNRVIKMTSDNTGAAFNIEIGASADAEMGGDAYTLLPNTTYNVSYRYMFGKDSFGVGSKLNIGSTYFGVDSATSGKTAITNSISDNITVEGAFSSGKDSATNAGILAADSQWQFKSFSFTTGATVDKPHLYITIANQAQYTKYAYLDDICVDVVDGVKNDLNNKLVYNFKHDVSGSPWTIYETNATYINNIFAKESTIEADGVHFTSYNYANPASGAGSRKKCVLYDIDAGGYLQLSEGATYMFTVKYKAEKIETGDSRLALAYSSAGGRDPLLVPRPAGGQHTLTPFATTDVITAAQTDWQYFTATHTVTDATKGTWVYLTQTGGATGKYNTYHIESVTVYEIRNANGAAIINFEPNGNYVEPMAVPAGTVIADLPVPTNNDANKVFGGWYFDFAFKNAVPSSYTTVAGATTLYAKWSSERVTITFNNSGSIYTQVMAPNTVLSNPTRPNSKMFFEGWYTDLSFTNKVTNAPEVDTTLYAKYNYTLLNFNNGGVSDCTGVASGIVTDPDDPNNKCAVINGQHNGAINIEIGAYDAAGAPAYKLPKTNTKYYIEFKLKVLPGSTGGRLQLYTGDASAYDPTGVHGKMPISGIAYNWDDEAGEKGFDWITITAFYDVGDSFYREMVNFVVHNQLYLVVNGQKEGKNNNGAVNAYIDDIFVGEYTTEVPMGAVGVYYKTNSDEIAPSFGYAGEKLTLPEDPRLSSHKFLGWYSDMSFTNEFTSDVFPDKTTTLYAKWETEDWECKYDSSFTKVGMSDRYNMVTEANGNQYIRYNFAQGTSGVGANYFGRAMLNNGLDDIFTVTQGCTYVMTFRYKVEEVNVAGAIAPVTCKAFDTWNTSKEQTQRLKIEAPTTGWEEGRIEFTAKLGGVIGNALALGVSGDLTVLIDDVKLVTTADFSNVYGSTIIFINTNGGPSLHPISGNVGDTIVLPKNMTRPGYVFAGWYADEKLTTKFTQTVYGEDNATIYAAWLLGKFTESFEDLPATIATQGISSAYTVYSSKDAGFNKENVHSGNTSIFRKGSASGTKSFTLCRNADLTLGVGEQYTVSFYVKLASFNDATASINLIGMTSNTSVSAPDSTVLVKNISELKLNEWTRVSYTFTATEPYIGISTSSGNDMYFDDFTVNLVGYTGQAAGGDTSVNPIFVILMVVIAAGALTVTGKKVFG